MIYFSQYDLFKNKFLKKEIQKWQKDGLLDENSIIKLKQHYNFDDENSVKFPFFILVYIFFGLALITIFVSNWNNLTNFIKTTFLISMTFATYLLAYYHFIKKDVNLTAWLLFFANLFLGFCLVELSKIYKFNIQITTLIFYQTIITMISAIIIKSKILSLELFIFATFCITLCFIKFNHVPWFYLIFLTVSFFTFQKNSKRELYFILSVVIIGLFYWLVLYGRIINDIKIPFYFICGISLFLAFLIKNESLLIVSEFLLIALLIFEFKNLCEIWKLSFIYFWLFVICILAIYRQKLEVSISLFMISVIIFITLINYNLNPNLIKQIYIYKFIFLYGLYIVLATFLLSIFMQKYSEFFGKSLKNSSFILGGILLWILFYISVKDYNLHIKYTQKVILSAFTLPLIFVSLKNRTFLNLSAILLFLAWNFGFFEFLQNRLSWNLYFIIINISTFSIAVIFALYLILNDYKRSGIFLIFISILIKFIAMIHNELSLSLAFLIFGFLTLFISKKILKGNKNEIK